MLARIVMLFALATTVLLQGCLGIGSVPQDERVDDVVRIFMHERGRYTVLKQSAVESSIVEQKVPGYSCDATATYVPDVPKDQPMWLSVHYEGTYIQYSARIIFHVHSAQDIGGAGWNHGKAGSGQTVVVQ